MNLWQKTLIRIGAASVLLAILILRFFQFGYSLRTNMLVAGATLAVGGAGSLAIRPFLYKKVPTIDDQLTPMFGYGLPKKARVPFLVLLVVIGVGLIAWATLILKYPG